MADIAVQLVAPRYGATYWQAYWRSSREPFIGSYGDRALQTVDTFVRFGGVPAGAGEVYIRLWATNENSQLYAMTEWLATGYLTVYNNGLVVYNDSTQHAHVQVYGDPSVKQVPQQFPVQRLKAGSH